MYRDHRKGPGGPSGGATYPGGPHGLKWGRDPAPGGLVRPPWASPAPRVGNPRGGGRPTWLGGQATPLGRRPPGPLYTVGGGRAAAPQPLAPPSPSRDTSPSRLRLAKPCRDPATSTTTPSCCWISINLSFPLAGLGRRIRLPNRTCVECGGVVRSALGSSVIWITASTTPSTPFTSTLPLAIYKGM